MCLKTASVFKGFISWCTMEVINLRPQPSGDIVITDTAIHMQASLVVSK